MNNGLSDFISVVREAVDRDVYAYHIASNIIGKLINYLMNGDPKNYYGFQFYRFADGEMMTLRGSDIGLTGKDGSLWLRFAKMEGYAPQGHISELMKSRETVITIFCLDSIHDVDKAVKTIIYNHVVHDMLLHELIHFADSKRIPNFFKNNNQDVGTPGYFNSPKEYNAYFNNIAYPLVHFLNAARRSDNVSGLKRMAKSMGISRDFKANLAMMVQQATNRRVGRPFYDTLTPERRRALLKRLYALHQEVVTILDTDEEPQAMAA